ncbi:27555_t:CDS:2 [Dentiscutata erythropus]|uniref:27555_t:CDS:1 n=1 Tax=Dentiscutata erythropus TaxID=1348616 RepID=A0A9N9DFJ6_9GLOM|nr:27555_t:CDS:2 [Dentiscutata erythropus]
MDVKWFWNHEVIALSSLLLSPCKISATNNTSLLIRYFQRHNPESKKLETL